MKNLIEKIHNYSLEEIMSERFAAYSKYIIQDRAIPDVRDGLKPVQRRILFSMYREKNTYDKQYRKSAKTVGDVISNFHPHGDIPIYEAMVRMSQNWKVKNTYINMHGNNGSMDGDSAAAYRYTEARLSKISNELLKDLDKDTVIFTPNYDDTCIEPTVLPAKFPNLIVNGTNGISAGYATNIPPHNLVEIIEATIKRIESPNCRLETIMDIVKGPDFPTGGIASGINGIKEAYETGKGKIILRGRTNFEVSKGKASLIITEIPYEVNKALLVKRIDEIRLDKKIDGISEVRDETDRHGLRIAIDLKSGANKEAILNYLLKNTDLQISFNFNMVAIANKRPKVLGLLEILDYYIAHQKEVILKRSDFDLKFAKARLHIVEGLVRCMSIIDEVVKTIRSSKNKSDAINNLVSKLQFSFKQSEAIVSLQLYRLTNTDVLLLEEEKEKLLSIISKLESIINNEEILKKVQKEELRKIANEYGEKRKTDIEHEITEIKLDATNLIAKEKFIVVITNEGYIKKVNLKSYNSSNNEETTLKPGDYVTGLYEVNSLDKIILFTNLGNYLFVPVHTIIETKWKEIGKHISNNVDIKEEERIIGNIVLDDKEKEIVMFTKNGTVKRITLKDFEVSRYSKPLKAIKLKENDEVVNVCIKDEETLCISNNGYYLKFNTEEIPLTSVKSGGVKGINLKEDILISGMCFNNKDEYINVFTNNKTAKRIKINELNTLTRAKKGSMIIKKVKTNNYLVIKAFITNSRDEFIIKINEEFNEIKNSEIPIMNIPSTGGVISKKDFSDVSKKVNLISFLKKESLETTEKEEKVKEMTIENFLDDFKL